jgi:hypothetical protein
LVPSLVVRPSKTRCRRGWGGVVLKGREGDGWVCTIKSGLSVGVSRRRCATCLAVMMWVSMEGAAACSCRCGCVSEHREFEVGGDEKERWTINHGISYLYARIISPRTALRICPSPASLDADRAQNQEYHFERFNKQQQSKKLTPVSQSLADSSA